MLSSRLQPKTHGLMNKGSMFALQVGPYKEKDETMVALCSALSSYVLKCCVGQHMYGSEGAG